MRLSEYASTRKTRGSYKIPRSVQQSIPIDRIYADGVWQSENVFSLMWQISDIWYSQTGRELYFNLRDDPHETKNALDENPERVAELRALLINALKNREEQYTDGHTLFVGKTPLTVLQNTEVL